MPAAILEVPTLSFIPKFVPFGVLYYTQDTGNIYVGTGSSDPPNVELVASAGTPGGFSGDIQYNNAGQFGGSAATIDSNGNITNLASAGNGNTTLTFGSGNTGIDLNVNGTDVIQAAAGLITIQDSNDTDVILDASDGSLHLDSSGITYMGADGGILVGATTPGGAQGSSTINAAGIFVNGVAVSTQGFSGKWSDLVSATAPLVLGNGNNGTTFNQTSPVTFAMTNTTSATSGTAQSSPLISLNGQYWNGSASATDNWTLQDVVGSGTNGTSTLAIAHSGSTGAAAVTFPSGTFNNPAIAFSASNSSGLYRSTTGSSGIGHSAGGLQCLEIINSSSNAVLSMPNTALVCWQSGTNTNAATGDTGLSRISAGTLGLGNGTKGDATGSLQCKSITIGDTAANTDLTIQNTTLSTSGTSQPSPLVTINGTYWTGAASAADSWTIQNKIGNGTNGTTTLAIGHSGSTGTALVQLPTNVQFTNNNVTLYVNNSTTNFLEIGTGIFTYFGPSGAANNNFTWGNGYTGLQIPVGAMFAWATTNNTANGINDTALSRVSAAVVAVGSSAQGDTTGVLLANGGHGISLVSTTTISSVAPVKADTSNANQVVVTATTDTAPGIVMGVCINSPNAGAKGQVITTGIAPMVLGTGTVAIGNWIIVDTTTNGRVKATTSYPPAGCLIGIALATQSTVGNSFNVAVGLR